jgi:hypothetical protein
MKKICLCIFLGFSNCTEKQKHIQPHVVNVLAQNSLIVNIIDIQPLCLFFNFLKYK